MAVKWTNFVNENEVRKALSVFKPDNQLFEVRILKNAGGRKSIISGYFKDPDVFFSKLDSVDLRDTNVYFSLGYLNEALYSRSQRDTLRQVSQTTADNEIDGYQWFFVDVDPVRPAGVSSSNDELKKAGELVRGIAQYLEHLGFEKPVRAISGNGYHLLYNVRMKNTPENVNTVERCLKALSLMFDEDDVKVDTSNYNPARICKLHGTLAQKGANTKERPHRLSMIYDIPDEIRPTPTAFLEKLAAEAPEPEPRNNGVKPGASYQRFDLEDWLHKYGITYKKREGDRSLIYALDECPFDHSHKDGDSKIFQYSDGAVAFKCHHNSCSQYRWQDVRAKFEPEAYIRPEFDSKYDEGWKQHNRAKQAAEIQRKQDSPEDQSGIMKIFRTAPEILLDPEPEYEYIKTGILTIDRLTAGLAKTELTALSGLTGSGKSTLLAQLMLNAVENGHRVVCYSGEMSNKKYLNWIIRQAAGKTNVVKSTKIDEEYLVNNHITQGAIAQWMGDNFRLYDNRQGNDFTKIRASLEKILNVTKADLCVVDNLMILDLAQLDQDKYEAQKKFVISLKDLAMTTNCHVVFVAHPRKTSGLLKLSDIAGSANIGNILDNGYIVHRVNAAFERAYREEHEDSPYNVIPKGATNVIEIVKDREHGHQSRFIPLYYENETKRLKNSPTENVVYGWNKTTSMEGFYETHREQEF